MTAAVLSIHSRKHDRRTEAEEAWMEVRAAGQEMVSAGKRIEYAILSDRSDLVLHVAARLQVLGEGYSHPDPEDAA